MKMCVHYFIKEILNQQLRKNLKKNSTFVYHTVFNTIGYNLIQRKLFKDAIEVFQLNVKENPSTKSNNYLAQLNATKKCANLRIFPNG